MDSNSPLPQPGACQDQGYFPQYPAASPSPVRSNIRPLPVRHSSASAANANESSRLSSAAATPNMLSPHQLPKAKSAAAQWKGKLSTDMIKDKLCWICYSSEADDDEVHRKGRWVHPCKCNLFCHESCLLSWIAEYQSRDERRDFASTVSCPQCKTPYIIRQSPSRLLETLEGLKKGWEKLSTRAAVCGVGFGITSISYVYGMSACQAFLGPQAFDQLIRQPTGQIPLKHWAFMPWVAPGLVLSRTNLIDGLLPVVPLLLLNIPPHSFFTGDYSRMISGLTVPGPATTCLMLPFVRHAYRRVRAWVFSKAVKLATSRSRLGSSSWASQPATRVATPAPNTPAVQFDQPPELPPRRAGAEEGAEHDVFPPQPEDEHAVAAPGAMLTLSIHRVARVVVEALLLPFVSAVAGEALLEASQFSRTLRAILGVEDSLMVKPYLGWVPGGFLGTLDPAWWRNFIGGSLCVVAKDVVDLLRVVLARRRLDSRSIVDADIDPSLDVKIADSKSNEWSSAS